MANSPASVNVNHMVVFELLTEEAHQIAQRLRDAADGTKPLDPDENATVLQRCAAALLDCASEAKSEASAEEVLHWQRLSLHTRRCILAKAREAYRQHAQS